MGDMDSSPIAQYIHSKFLNLRNNWSNMYYLNDVFTTFLGLKSDSCVVVNGGTESHQKDINLCSEEERKSYRF